MKYIRTKERVISFERYSQDNAFKNVLHTLITGEKSEDIEIIKQADTIEELGDCFIAVDKNGNLCENPMIAKGHCFKSFCNYYKANGIDVDCYLAILTDKGLIYAAKMNNDKGEPELL